MRGSCLKKRHYRRWSSLSMRLSHYLKTLSKNNLKISRFKSSSKKECMKRLRKLKFKLKKMQLRRMMMNSEELKRTKNLLKSQLKKKKLRRNQKTLLKMSTLTKSRQSLPWLMNLTILQPKISLFMLNMMIFRLLIVDHPKMQS